MPRKHTYEHIKDYIEKREHKLLSVSYINSKTKLKLSCKNGHIFETKYNDFQQGHGCMLCRNKNISKMKTKTYESVKEFIEDKGYFLLSDEYKGVFDKLKIKCDKGHVYESHFGNFKNCGNRCPECGKHFVTSRGEKEVVSFVKKVYKGEVIENDKTQIVNYNTGRNLELDIWLPELMKAIEFNGSHWHEKKRSKYNDSIKLFQCENKGIDLLVIDYDKWRSDKSNCQREIRNWIGE